MTTMAPPSEGPQRATIVGGGPCGSLLAMFLLEAGFETDVYELRDEEEVEKEGDQGGFGKAASATKRSINFALSHRGISALQKLSLDGDILAKSVEMHSRYLHLPDGSTATQKYGKPGEAIYSVSRPNVVGLLEAAARKRGAVYHHGHKLVGLDEALRPKFERPGGEGPPVTLESNGPLFGCDGAFSATRRFMERRGRFDTRVWYAKQGYKELSIPADAKGGYVYPPNYLHIWPRGDTMLIALPNTDGSFTSTLFANCDELEDMEQNWTREAVAKWFRDNFGDAVDLMPTVVDDFYGNPTAPLVQLQVAPWHLGSKVLCLGDASHAVVPFYGQGMNAAFEDCLVFSEILAENRNDVAKTFEDMSGRRRRAADALSVLATANYEDMAHNTASRLYRVKSAIERALAGALPKLWTPLYSMVTFSRLPYDEVVAQHARQQAIVDRVAVAGSVFAIVLAAALARAAARLPLFAR